MFGRSIILGISSILLIGATITTVALLWGKKGVRGPQNVSIISKAVYYVIMGILFCFGFLFLFNAVQKL